MSVCAHRQYHHLSKLPRCPKCKGQLTTVLSRYDNGIEQWEWECIKCSRFFPITMFSKDEDNFESFLHHKFGENKDKKVFTPYLVGKKKKRRKHGRK